MILHLKNTLHIGGRMGTVVKLSPPGNVIKYIGPNWLPEHVEELIHTTDRFSVCIPPSTVALSGKQGNPEMEGTLIPAQARVLLTVKRPIKIWHYTCLVSPNPRLCIEGTVNCPSVLNVGEGEDFLMSFTPQRAFDLTKLDWLIKLTFLD
jgi:hypothetical protein